VGADYLGGQFTAACLKVGTSSFADFLGASAPELLPGARTAGPAALSAAGSGAGGGPGADLPHGTTIVAVDFTGGVIMVGDRRSTAGSMIAQRDIEKVFRSYEKLEGRTLSLEGKANRLAAFVRGNLGGAMQGLVVVPLYAGYDEETGKGRIFSYDPAGGRYEERNYHSIGSGSVFARGALKKLYTAGMAEDEAVTACMQALYDAADDDSATGGPDLARRIYPVVAVITEDGFRRLTDDEAGEYVQAVVAERLQSPGGPTAPLRQATT